MSGTATEVRQWMVSARARGEVRTTSVRAPGVELLLLGAPASYDPDEIEGWLRDLIAVSRETAAGDSGTRPIPALLHHLLTGLLFSHAEVWSRSSQPAPLSLAFVRTDRLAAFGWVGLPTPDIWLDDQPASVDWVRIRDQAGNEARSPQSARVIVTSRPAHSPVPPAPQPAAEVVAPRAAPVAPAPEIIAQPMPASPMPLEAQSAPGVIEKSKVVVRAAPVSAPSPPAIALSQADIEPPAPEPVTLIEAPANPPAAASAGDWTVVYEGEPGAEPPAPEIEPQPRANWWQRVIGWFTRRGRAAPPPDVEPGAGETEAPASLDSSALEPVAEGGPEQIEADVLPELVPPTPEPAELTSRTVEPILDEGPTPADYYEPMAT